MPKRKGPKPTPTPRPSRALPIEELMANFDRSEEDSLRLRLAMRRAWPGHRLRFRRAASFGPNADKWIVKLWHPTTGKQLLTLGLEQIVRLRASVTEKEVQDQMLTEIARSERDPEPEDHEWSP